MGVRRVSSRYSRANASASASATPRIAPATAFSFGRGALGWLGTPAEPNCVMLRRRIGASAPSGNTIGVPFGVKRGNCCKSRALSSLL